MESQLARAPYNEINMFFKSAKGLKWYTYDSGCHNFEELCGFLKYQIHYDVFYRHWSGVTHSSKAYMNNIIVDEKKGETGISAIRALHGYKDVIEYSIGLIALFYNNFYEKALPAFWKRHQIYNRRQLNIRTQYIRNINLTPLPGSLL